MGKIGEWWKQRMIIVPLFIRQVPKRAYDPKSLDKEGINVGLS